MTYTKELLSYFMQLVKIDSPTGEEERCARPLFQFLRKHAHTVKRDAFGNIYAYFEGQGSPLFFSAHMDTVEPGRGIIPLLKNEYIVSSGSTILGGDNKAAIACMMVLAQISGADKQAHRPFEFVLTRSEESGNYGAINFDYTLLRARNGFCFDTPYPVGTIVTASPIYERCDVVISGKESHASKPEEAINTLLILRDILQRFHLGRIAKNTLFNIGIVKAGFARNTVPGEAILTGEIRSLDEGELTKNKRLFEKIVKSTVKTYHAQSSLHFIRENGGYVHKSVSARRFVTHVISCIKNCRIKPRTIVDWAVSDANIFNEKGLICANMGNGIEFSHSRSERIRTKELLNMVRLMLELIKQ